MPMTFTDEMVARRAKDYNISTAGLSNDEIRKAVATETEKQYGDFIEAHEIRTGTPWDEWTKEQTFELANLHRAEPKLTMNPGFLSMMAKHVGF